MSEVTFNSEKVVTIVERRFEVRWQDIFDALGLDREHTHIEGKYQYLQANSEEALTLVERKPS